MLEQLRKNYNKLCKPSQFYLFISITSIIIMLVQNLSTSNKYCVGSYECDLEFPNIILFVSKLAYVTVWAIIFDSLCKNGYTNLAWGIILVPFILMFMIIGMFIFSKM
jgi:hypothetical protein